MTAVNMNVEFRYGSALKSESFVTLCLHMCTCAFYGYMYIVVWKKRSTFFCIVVDLLFTITLHVSIVRQTFKVILARLHALGFHRNCAQLLIKTKERFYI